MYIKNLIENDYKMWKGGDSIFIKAPTGTGKTTFVLNQLLEEAKKDGREVLYLNNRFLLKEQVKSKVIQMQGLTEIEAEIVEKTSEFDGITILSYQELQEYIEHNSDSKYKSNRYKFVVFDEIHYLMEDALFNPKIIYLLDFIKHAGQTKIFMSATLDEVEEFLLDEGIIGEILWGTEEIVRDNVFRYHINKCLEQILPGHCCLWKYDIHKQNHNIKTYYFEEIEEVIDEINKSKDKFLIFVNNKEKSEKWKDKIHRKVDSISADCKSDEVLKQIINKEKFEADVLLTTKVLDNGVNFIDSSLKGVVLNTASKTEFIQMLGRKRLQQGEEIDLFIPIKSVNYFNGLIYMNIKESLAKIEQIKYTDDFLNELLENKEFFNVARKFFVFDNKVPKVNICAVRKLENQKEELIRMKSEIEEDKYAFVKEQLNWLDLDDDFDLDNDLSLRRIKRNKEKLFRFLENNVDCFMDKVQQKAFSSKLMKLFNEAKYVESSCTSCGKNKINKTFKECELPFEIVSKKGQRKGEQSLWILRKREV